MAQQLLRLGSSGLDVERLQDHLNRCAPVGFNRLDVDGRFGPKTHARVIFAQKISGLTVDGIVGPNTENAIIILAQDVSAPETATAIDDWNNRRTRRRATVEY